MKPRKKVVIIGSSGMLGQDLLHTCLESDCCDMEAFSDRSAVDITNEPSLRDKLSGIAPNVIINAAAYTDVDGAESNRTEADNVNHRAAASLAKVAAELRALLVHFSTDYVFSGNAVRPYRVNDPVDPVNYYGRTKLEGENAIRASGCHHLIIRSSWLFAPHGRNFVKTILRTAATSDQMQVVVDQRGRPTSTVDLARATCSLVQQGVQGTCHVANTGDCSWYEFADAIVAGAGLDCRIDPIETRQFPRPAARPHYSVLDLSETTPTTGHPRHWRDALAECLDVILYDGVDADADRVSLLCG